MIPFLKSNHLLLIFCTLLLLSNKVSGQDTVYVDRMNFNVASKEKAFYIKVIHAAEEDSIYFTQKYDTSMILIEDYSGYLNDRKDFIKHGVYKNYFKNGEVKRKVNYQNNLKSDSLYTFYVDGTYKRRDFYRNDSLISGQCYGQSGEIVEHFPYYQPYEYPGGEQEMYKYLRDNIHYPIKARNNGIMGTVYVVFLIDKQGRIIAPKVLKGIGAGCDRESIRVVKGMNDWIPAKIDGEPEEVIYILPIQFRLG